jgi:V8-like Glu-specific endopeptidase
MEKTRIYDISVGSFQPSEVVFGTDDRVRVDDITGEPWRRICSLRIGGPSGELFAGTGWILGRYTVATAGHCVYLRELASWASYVDVRIEQANGVPRRILRSRNLKSTSNWIENVGPQYDLGLIILDEPLGDELGSFAFGTFSNAELVGTATTVCGYPADRDHGRNQYRDTRQILAVDPYALRYRIDTFEGQSGAPVWLDVNGTPVVVGVHVSGALGTNAAVRINDDVRELLRSWRDLEPGASNNETALITTKTEGLMGIVEQGNQGKGKNGKRPSAPVVSRPETTTSAIATEDVGTTGVVTDTITGVIARLIAAESSPEERLKIQALVVGSLLVIPKQEIVESDLPILFEFLRSGKARGSEWLFLTMLSAAAASSPELARRYSAMAGLIPLKANADGKDFFCDLSGSNTALLTTFNRKSLPEIFARLAKERDIGVLVRTTGGFGAVSTQERDMLDPWAPDDFDSDDGGGDGGGGFGGFSGGIEMPAEVIVGDPFGPQRRYDACVDHFTAIGAAAGGFFGQWSPIGPNAGVRIGEDAGRAVGRYVCAERAMNESANLKREDALVGGANDDEGFVPLPDVLPGGVIPIVPRPLPRSTMPDGVYPPWWCGTVDPIPPWRHPIHPDPRPMYPPGTTPPIVRPPMPALETAALSAADFGSPQTLTIERIGEETYLLHVK